MSLFDVLFANNTVAIIFSGDIAREIARKHNIPPAYSAAWLDIFSCVFQGIPHGAQILLASSIAGVSPFGCAVRLLLSHTRNGCHPLYLVYVNLQEKGREGELLINEWSEISS